MSQATPQPTAQGNLTQTPFAHLLMYVLQRELTGTLVVWPAPTGAPANADASEDRIYVKGGYPIAFRLMVNTSTVELGLLPLFTRVGAPYAFYDQADLLGDAPTIKRGRIDPWTLTAAALRGSTRDDVVEAVVARLGDTPLRVKPGTDLKRFHLDPKEQGFVDLVRADPSPAQNLLTGSGLPPRNAARLLYLLAITKAIEPFDAAQRPAEVGDGRTSPGTFVGVRPQWSSGQTNARARIPVPPTRQTGGGTLAGSPGSSPGTTPATPPAQVTQTPVGQRAPGATTQSTVTPPKAPNKPDPNGVPVPPSPPAGLSEDLLLRWKEIAMKVRSIDEENYFAMLGVKRNTDPVEIRSKYFELAKQWHPDRLPPQLAPLKEVVEFVFRQLTEAHDTLTNAEEAKKYAKLVEEGGGTIASQRMIARVLEGVQEFQQAEVALKRKDWSSALGHVKRSLELNDKDPEALTMLGWCLFNVHAGVEYPHAEIIEAFDKALALSPKHERATLYKAMTLKRANQPDEALKLFKIVAKLNPKNIDAQREIRLVEIRKTQGTGGEKPAFTSLNLEDTFLGKMFAKKDDKKK